jgi:hypothetical protein
MLASSSVTAPLSRQHAGSLVCQLFFLCTSIAFKILQRADGRCIDTAHVIVTIIIPVIVVPILVLAIIFTICILPSVRLVLVVNTRYHQCNHIPVRRESHRIRCGPHHIRCNQKVQWCSGSRYRSLWPRIRPWAVGEGFTLWSPPFDKSCVPVRARSRLRRIQDSCSESEWSMRCGVV